MYPHAQRGGYVQRPGQNGQRLRANQPQGNYHLFPNRLAQMPAQMPLQFIPPPAGTENDWNNRFYGYNGVNRLAVANGIIPANGNYYIPPGVAQAAPQAASAGDSDRTETTIRASSVIGGNVIQPTPRPAPRETFHTGKNQYTVIRDIVPPNNLPDGMNDGVRLIQHSNGEYRVEKRIRMSTETQKDRAMDEKTIMHQLADCGGSPHVNIIHESFWLPTSTHCSLILEYCDQGNLQMYIEKQSRSGKPISEEFCWHVLAHMSAALSLCHVGIPDPTKPQYKFQKWNCICHLDIKPHNVFLSSKLAKGHENDKFPRVVLGDYGCSVTKRMIDSDKAHKDYVPGGTEGWYPPESVFVEDGSHKGHYGKITDIWQMGGVIQVMCCYLGQPDQDAVDAKNPCGTYYSPELNKVVELCMRREYLMRPSAVDVAEEVVKQKAKFGWV